MASNCVPVGNLDGLPGEELVCILNSSDAPATNQRRVFALKYTPGLPLQQLWKPDPGPRSNGDAAWSELVADLDGDGVLEVIASGKDAADAWTTQIFDALTGAQLGAIIGGRVAGSAPIEATNKSLVLSRSAPRSGPTASSAAPPTP